jgi:hypothetical protein
MLDKILDDCDSHKILKYFKFAIRSVLAGLVGCSSKELKQEIEECLNELHNLKVKACFLMMNQKRQESRD